MFTGIIETLGHVTEAVREDNNIHFTLASEISGGLKIDQSVAHDGVCLTVVATGSGTHTVTAIHETLQRTNLKDWSPGRSVNLERCLALHDRLDGHIVQGHIDITGKCVSIREYGGSHVMEFSHMEDDGCPTVSKGSITINGVSLTVVDAKPTGFSVAVIPYTLAHTNLGDLAVGDSVNLEFDVVGKYVAELLMRRS